MFTSDERDHLRSELLEYASKDQRISGGAITGSAAAGRQDQWSDIDLAFGVGDAADVPSILSNWTDYMYERHLALHHVDVRSGAWIYRVFLLSSTLQVDLAFVAATDFRALAPTFRLMFGKSNEPRQTQTSQSADIIGWAWLYALHARSSIARRNLWQAEYMVSGVRDHALALACLRHGLPSIHGRGFALLPSAVAAQFEDGLVTKLEVAELSRAFNVVIKGLLTESRLADEGLAARLQGALECLVETSRTK